MKIKTLLITTVLSTGLIVNTPAAFAADSITAGTVKTASAPITKAEVADPRLAASGFVEHVNFARVALAMKNTDLAKQHITQAHNMIALIKNSAIEQRRVTEVESGRVVYQYDTEYKYHYFPIQTGPVQVKQVDNGPVWAVNDLAVTDADIVYLTLDLTGDKAENYLNDAEKSIAAADLKDADNQLAKLTDSVVSVSDKISVPSIKAQDNIALARNFFASKNYDGAGYALKHADEALDEMQNSGNYKSHQSEIISMRKEIADLRNGISKKDPSIIDKANIKLDKWWKEVKEWSNNEKK
jgi:hypothetical protein